MYSIYILFTDFLSYIQLLYKYITSPSHKVSRSHKDRPSLRIPSQHAVSAAVITALCTCVCVVVTVDVMDNLTVLVAVFVDSVTVAATVPANVVNGAGVTVAVLVASIAEVVVKVDAGAVIKMTVGAA